MRRDEDGVSTIVGALLVLSAIVVFLAVYNLTWVPTIQANREASRSVELRQAFGEWGDTAEAYVVRGLTNRSFSQSLPVGASGSGFTGAGGFTGSVALSTTPTLTVSSGATVISSVSGALQAESRYARLPQQTQRYVFGAVEVTQAGATFVDLRSLLVAQRSAGGLTGLTLQSVGLTGGAQNQGGGTHVEAVGTVESAASSAPAGGTIRILATDVAAAGWRAAAERTLGAAGLAGETSANCAASTLAWCLPAATNTATQFDLLVRNVQPGWTSVSGTVRVELRS